jgi:CheY-like chemotaxis protein
MDRAPRRDILLVDGDSDVRETIADVFEYAGQAVIQAVNGVDALAKLLELDAPCLALLDLLMPATEGLAFLERLRLDAQAGEFRSSSCRATETFVPPRSIKVSSAR